MTFRRIDLLVVHRQEAGHTGAQVALNEPHAYHLAVNKDGSVDWALSGKGFDLGFELPGQHATGYNWNSIAVALYGCFDPAPDGQELHPPPLNLHPTKAQLDTLNVLLPGLAWWSGAKHLMGHTELPHATRFPGKVCPGRHIDLDALRAKTGLTRLPTSGSHA